MTQFVAAWDDGVRVRWRSLTWAEYRKFRYKMLTQPLGVSLDIYTCVVLDGPDLDFLPAGIARYVADSVLKNSPFSGEIRLVEQALSVSRAKLASTYLLSAQALIGHLFRYTFEEMEAWDPEVFFERLAMAEFVAGKQLQPAGPQKEKAPKGNLWEQEKRQGIQPRPRPAGDEEMKSRELTSTQKKALDRVKAARRR